jgi:hypothetical protein
MISHGIIQPKSGIGTLINFESWIMSKTVSENERFDLTYILNSTFFYGFLDMDHKDIFTKGVYLHQDSVSIINDRITKVGNLKDFRMI